MDIIDWILDDNYRIRQNYFILNMYEYSSHYAAYK